jgi:cell division transport system ATP-binding protein
MENTDTVLHIEDAKIFQKETLVLTDVDIEVKKGDFIYVIGKTGSGKSSFMKVLYGDLELPEAKIAHIAGYDLLKLKRKQIPFLRRKLGIVFQDFQLLTDRTVQENLQFVMQATGWKDKNKMHSRIEEMLELVQLSTKAHKFPYQLSGGEQQRVAIARALINHPEIIIADEPTGNLDPKTSEDIMQVFVSINKELGTPVLMATHNYLLIEKFPGKVYICAQNKINHVESLDGL